MKHKPGILTRLALASLAIGLALPHGAYSAATTPTTTSPTTQTRPGVSPGSGQNVLAHGTDELLWVALIQPGDRESTFKTVISFRSASKPMEALVTLPVRIVDMANVGAQLAVLQETGDWLLVSQDVPGSSGQSLPGGVKPIALGNDAVRLYAIAEAVTTSTTQPTTLPALVSASHDVIMGPLPPPRMALYALSGNDWSITAPLLPGEMTPTTPSSLAVIDRVPYIAYRRENGKIRIIRLAGDVWQEIGSASAPTSPAVFKLLNMNPPALWIAGADTDRLELPTSAQATVVPLKPTHVPISDRAAVYAIHAVREIGAVEGKITEQQYNPSENLKPAGEATTVAIPAQPAPQIVTGLFRLAVTIAVIFAIFSSSRKRRDVSDDESESLALATMSRRLAAGLIDALPFIVPCIYVYRELSKLGSASTAPPQLVIAGIYWFMAAMAVYVLHTSILETITTRSIGKFVMGLRVVRTDGGTPDASALIIRNVLRIIDLGLACVPLVFVMVSPLRQRIGDVAAGTVVIRDRVRPEGNLIDEPKPDQAPAE